MSSNVSRKRFSVRSFSESLFTFRTQTSHWLKGGWEVSFVSRGVFISVDVIIASEKSWRPAQTVTQLTQRKLRLLLLYRSLLLSP
ncbi:MAG: hypothetical protein CBC48_04160 [bacterium TMED88]|nr:MAG: hypothetical protein CBC48_04160 [bacterium TMED88]